jgi:hypothetical protein
MQKVFLSQVDWEEFKVIREMREARKVQIILCVSFGTEEKEYEFLFQYLLTWSLEAWLMNHESLRTLFSLKRERERERRLKGAKSSPRWLVKVYIRSQDRRKQTLWSLPTKRNFFKV